MNAREIAHCLWAALLALLALVLVQSPSELTRETTPLIFNFEERGPLAVTVDQPLEIPGTWGDYDLIGEVELSEDCELDIVFRRMEPQVRGARFHGRFHLLRLSAIAEGPAYRTRGQALFGDASGGVRLGPGIPATIRIETRGNTAASNIAGRELPPVETLDDHGNVLLAAQSGKALLRSLEIHPRPAGGLGLGWFLAPIIGFLAGAAMVRSGSMRRYSWTGFLVPAGAFVSSLVVVAQMLPMTSPVPVTELCVALWCLPLAVALALRPLRLRYVLASALAGLLALELGSRQAMVHLQPYEDPRMSLYFGMRSGSAPTDALMHRIHSATSTDVMRPAERKVLFMGGKLVYEPLYRDELFREDLDDREILGSLTTSLLNGSLGGEVVGAVVPTLEPNALQQQLLLRTFYLGLAPRALVFAVTPAELQPVEGGNVRRQLEVVNSISPGAGLVLGTLLAGREVAPAGSPDDLRQALDELVALCREQEIALVLMMESNLDPELREVVRYVATENTLPLCVLDPRAEGRARARSLHDVLLPLLR